MADVLKRLAGPQSLTAAAATVYTVPTATSAVIRQLRVVNETATTASFTVSIGADAPGKRLWYAVSVAPGDPYDWTGSIALAAAETVQAYSATASALTLMMSGVESS
jgi:hypothetical protein